MAAAAEAVDALVNKASSEEARDRATRALYGQLITPFAKEIAELDRLYVAPDGGIFTSSHWAHYGDQMDIVFLR